MSEMLQTESLERVLEGLSRAASCCRELGKIVDAQEWKDLSGQLLIMRQKVLVLYKGKPLTEGEIIGLVTKMEIAQRASHYINGGV